MSAPTAARERAKPQAMFLWLLGLPVLAAIALGVGLSSGLQGAELEALALAVFTALLLLLPPILGLAIVPTERHIILSMFCITYLGYMVVPAFTYYLPARGPAVPAGMTWTLIGAEDLVRGQWGVLAGLLALLAAYLSPFSRILSQVLPAPTREWSVSECVTVALVMAGLGWLLFVLTYLGAMPKGLGSGFIGVIYNWRLYALLLLMFAYMRYGSRQALMLVCILLPISAFLSFFTASKKAFLSVPAMIAVAFIIYRGRLRIGWLLAGVVALIMLYPASAWYRNDFLLQSGRRPSDVIFSPGIAIQGLSDFLSDQNAAEYLQDGLGSTIGRLDSLGRAAVIMRETPDSVPFQGGWTIGYIALAYIPRVLWQDKPKINIGKWITAHYGTGKGVVVQQASNTGPSWIGEFYLNWGYAGIIGGMAFIGFMLRLAHETLHRRGGTIPALVVSGILIYKLSVTLGGGLSSSINGPMFSAGFVLGLHVLVRIFGRDPGLPKPQLEQLDPFEVVPPLTGPSRKT